MKSPTEKQINLNEKDLNLTKQSLSNYNLEDMYDEHMKHFNMISAEEAMSLSAYKDESLRTTGKSLFVHPDYGHGLYWHYIIDEQIALLVVDMIYNKNISFTMNTINMFYVGTYSAELIKRYRPITCNRPGSVIGNAWIQQKYHQSLNKNTKLKISSVAFTADAINKYARRLGCSLYEMTLAFSMLDGSFDVLELYNILKDINTLRPHQRYADAFYRNRVEELLLVLLDTLESLDKNKLKTDPQYQRIVYEACQYIHSNLETDLSTKNLSEKLYISEPQFIEAFKIVKKMTPQNYIRALRMNRAQELLKSDNAASVSKISELCGYTNQGAFCEAFKKQFGLTPSSFRKL